MIKLKIIYYFVFSTLFFGGCEKQYFGVILRRGFEKDNVKIEYGGKTILDSVVSTNYSTVVAHKMVVEKQKDKIMKVTVNNIVSDSLKIYRATEVIIIVIQNDSLILKRSAKLKKPRY